MTNGKNRAAQKLRRLATMYGSGGYGRPLTPRRWNEFLETSQYRNDYLPANLELNQKMRAFWDSQTPPPVVTADFSGLEQRILAAYAIEPQDTK